MKDDKERRGSLDLELISARLDELEESQKEREVSFLRALRTLIRDYRLYKDGERADFPESAAWGVVFAYFRPRLIVAVASIAALVLGGLQLWILANQNRLLDQQNQLVRMQNKSVLTDAAFSVLSAIDEDDDPSIVVAQLVSLGGQGFELLLSLVMNRSRLNGHAAEALARSVQEHSETEISEALADLGYAFSWSIDDYSFAIGSWSRSGHDSESLEHVRAAFRNMKKLGKEYFSYALSASDAVQWEDIEADAQTRALNAISLILKSIAELEAHERELVQATRDIVEDEDWELNDDFFVAGVLQNLQSWCGNPSLSTAYSSVDWSMPKTQTYQGLWDYLEKSGQQPCANLNMFRPQPGLILSFD